MVDYTKCRLSICVSHYLMSCFLYYELDINVIDDDTFNYICERLLKEYDNIEHMHKHLLDKDALKGSTGYDITYPNIVKQAAMMWYNDKRK